MRRIILFVLLFALCGALSLSAQVTAESDHFTVTGRVLDSLSLEPLPRVVLQLFGAEEWQAAGEGGTPLAFAFSDGRGSFELAVTGGGTQSFVLIARRAGYRASRREIIGGKGSLGEIWLAPETEELPEVTVIGPPITSSGDTVIYRAEAFLTPNAYSVEDLIKRMPGLSVDGTGGIAYMGESIQGVYIEGQDLVARDYTAATRILKASDISAVEVMEDFQPVKMLRGIEEQRGAMLNIRLKNSRMLTPSGEASVGAGSLGEKELLYDATGNLLLVNNRTQILAAGDLGTASGATEAAGNRSPGAFRAAARDAAASGFSAATAPEMVTGLFHGGVSVNQLLPLKGDGETTIKYNAGYGRRVEETASGETVRLNNGSSFTDYTDSRSERNLSESVVLGLNYLRNSDSLYLDNTLTLYGGREDLLRNIERSGTGITDRTQAKEYRAEDRLSFISMGSGGMIRLEGAAGYAALPEMTMAAPEGVYGYLQRIRGTSFYGTGSVKYGYNPGGLLSFYGDLAVRGQQDDIAITDEESGAVTESGLGQLTLTTSPTLGYTARTVRWRLSLPLQLLLYGYDAGAAGNGRAVRFLPGANFSLTINPGSKWRMYGEAFWRKKSAPTLMNFLVGSYRLSFDQKKSLEAPLLPETVTGGVSFSSRYRNPIRGFFLRNSLSYRTERSNTVMGRNTLGTIRESAPIETPGRRHFLSGDLYGSYLFPGSRTTLSLSAGYGYARLPLILGGNSFALVSHDFRLTPSLSLSPARWMEAVLSGRYARSLGSGSIERMDSEEWGLSAALHFTISPRVTLSVNSDTASSAFGEGKPRVSSLLGAGMIYRGGRLRVSLEGQNLLDSARSYLPRFTEGDLIDGYRLLRPRQLLLRLFYKF